MSVIPAALIAAGFVFGAASAEARHAHKSGTASSAGKSVAAAKTSHHSSRSASHHSTRTFTSTSTSTSKGKRGSARSSAVEHIAPEVYGPVLPLEVYDYPRPPCTEHDAVVEATLHDAREETPEPDFTEAELDEVVVPPPAGAITRMARSLGSLLRPKSAESTVRPEDVDLSDLMTAGVQIPVEGVDATRLKDSFLNSRGSHRQHLAIDIGAPQGTPVLAAADGEVTSLRREKRGGISLYQKDSTGRYLLFYCHLTRYKKGLRPGQKVSKGDVLAYVGRTGHVIGGPHLHFSITRLPDHDDDFRAGVAINPYLLFLAAVP
ncbi:MAG TPA: M23 family metallopeptidase [Thermoanaerobaculia bacterium]|jgi:murein DD-endopeptidase MepM/ murein hydrolase activator NlpD